MKLKEFRYITQLDKECYNWFQSIPVHIDIGQIYDYIRLHFRTYILSYNLDHMYRQGMDVHMLYQGIQAGKHIHRLRDHMFYYRKR